MKTRTTQGMALVTVLLLMVLLMGVLAVTFQLTMSNIAQSRTASQTARTMAVSQGARNLGQTIIRGPVGERLGSTIVRMAQSNRIGNAGTWAFASGETGTAPTASTVANNLTTLANELQSSLSASGCYGPYRLTENGNQTVSVRISFTGVIPACDGAGQETVTLGVGRYIAGSRSGTQTYSLPYVMVVSAVENDARRTLTINGEFQFDVGNGSFARFALFTDEQQTSTEAAIYFTDRTLFNGPVHTNGNFAFRGQPWFGGAVTSSGTTDRRTPGAFFTGNTTVTRTTRDCFLFFCTPYYTVTETQLSSAFLAPSQLSNPSYGDTVPQFNGGVDWQAANIPFPTSSTSQQSIAATGGITITDNPANIQFSVVTLNSVKYQRILVGTTEYLANESGALFKRTSTGQYVAATNASGQAITSFNGVIYSANPVASVRGPTRTTASDPNTAPPAIASFSQMTLASPGDIRVTGDLKYETNPCNGSLRRDSTTGNVIVPTCNDDPLQVKNVLGIYSSGGDIKLGYQLSDSALNVPEDVQIQATMMGNKVRVENHNTGGCTKGTAYVLGGVIQRQYGAFGTFNNETGACSNGLGRSFTYDQRMLQGLAPPAFPTTSLTSLLANRRSIQFNQSEQTRR